MCDAMIRIGIIGYGYWGPNLARCFAEAEGAQLAAICDRSPDALARASRRFPGTSCVTDAASLIADTTIDAVVIATPVRTHYTLALAALRAGKHVLVEKPMTETSAQAEILIEEATKRNLLLMVDHTFCYTPAVQKIRELVSAGELGQVYYYDSIRVNLGLFHPDVNALWDLAVHDFAILEYVLDEHPIAVSASGARHVVGGQENMAHVTLFFDSGTTAHVNVNWLAPVKVRQVLVGGSRKMVVYDDLQPSEKIKVYDKGVTIVPEPDQLHEMRVGYRTGDMWAPQIPTREALKTEVDHFIDCIAHGAAPLTGGDMGLRVVELLEGASASMGRRGYPVEFGQLRRAS
jgi:predicted dehydrogenase